MEHDVSAFLSFELKRELAERYFGFRRLIEDDCAALAEDIRHLALTAGQRLGREVVRIGLLLADKDLIHEFFALTGLDQETFFDPYLLTDPATRQALLSGLAAPGLTARGRFRRLVLGRYQELLGQADGYRKTVARLLTEEELIHGEIEVFHRQNDIASLLDFFRRLEPESQLDTGGQEDGGWQQPGRSIADKLRLPPPPAVADSLAILPPLPAMATIEKELKRLADAAYRLSRSASAR